MADHCTVNLHKRTHGGVVAKKLKASAITALLVAAWSSTADDTQ